MCVSNNAAMLLVWLPFVWCFSLLSSYAGATSQFEHQGAVFGTLLILSTVSILVMVMRKLIMDVVGKAKNIHKTRRAKRQFQDLAKWEDILRQEGRVYREMKKMHAKLLQEDQLFTMESGEGGQGKEEQFEKGDFLVVGSRGNTYPMTRTDFMARYNIAAPGEAENDQLASEGFQLFNPIGKVWAHELTADECSRDFSDGTFEGRRGGKKAIAPTDLFLMVSRL